MLIFLVCRATLRVISKKHLSRDKQIEMDKNVAHNSIYQYVIASKV